jgi:hypothetical protein
MIASMGQLCMTEAELSPKDRLLSECVALAEARRSTATLDEGFMKDVEEGIARRSQPWNPPAWK